MLEDNPLEMVITGRSTKPPRILIFGVEKIGKTTWATEAENAIVIPTEDGQGQIDCKRFPLARTYEQVLNYIGTLIEREHDFKTLVIDSADWLERLIWAKVCQDSNVKSIELAAGGYGKGYGAALVYWSEILEALDAANSNRNMQIILIAHAQVERYEDPESPAYDRYSPKLHKKTSGPLVTEWADAVLFATRKMRVAVEKGTFNRERATAAPIGKDGGERIIRCVGSPACVAGNRYGLPAELPLIYSEFVKAMSANI